MIIMAGNATTESNSTVSDNDNENTYGLLLKIGNYTQLSMTLATLIYGVTSWCLIKKFRNFNNYVYLNAIIVTIIRLIVVSITNIYFIESITKFTHFLIFIFFSTVFNYWLLVMSYMFYVDVVKVFNGSFKKKFLTCFLLAWCVPMIGLTVGILVLFIVELTVESNYNEYKFNVLITIIYVIILCDVTPLLINVVFFLRLIHSLFSCKGENDCVVPEGKRKKVNWRRLCTARVMFMLTNVNILVLFIWDFFYDSMMLRTVTFSIQTFVLSLFVPLVKSNRTLWHEYFKNRLK